MKVLSLGYCSSTTAVIEKPSLPLIQPVMTSNKQMNSSIRCATCSTSIAAAIPPQIAMGERQFKDKPRMRALILHHLVTSDLALQGHLALCQVSFDTGQSGSNSQTPKNSCAREGVAEHSVQSIR